MKKGTAIFPGWLFPFVYCVAGVDAYEKSSKSFSDLLLSLAADGRWIFSFESSGQVGPMMDSTINSCFPFKALCIFSISLDDYFFHNQSMYL